MAANTENPTSHPASEPASKAWADGLGEVCRLLAEYDRGEQPELDRLAEEMWRPRLETQKQANSTNSENTPQL